MAICCVCAREDLLRKGRCPACNAFFRDNGYERPDHLVVKAAKRFERKMPGHTFGEAEETAMTIERYSGPIALVDCSCGCGKPADYGYDGLAKRCADLIWYRSQRTASIR